MLKSPKMRSLLLNLSLAIISILIALLIGETALQLRIRYKTGNWLWENSTFRIGYTQPVEDRRQYALRPRYSDHEAGITINKLGFREAPSEKNMNKLVIVCLGDSVPFGAGVRDHETYPAFLNKIVSSNGFPMKVLNAGVPSYNLRQSFDRFRIDVISNYLERCEQKF